MIIPIQLKNGYEIISTMDGYCLCFPDGDYKWFAIYDWLEKYAQENGIDLS